jgi:hypothetical protein
MADTQRTRAAILTLLADNVTGQISAQDLRDFVVTAMQPEFVNANDFWAQPLEANLTSEGVRGWIMYSQTISVGCSFGNAMAMTANDTWTPANASTSTANPCHGIAGSNYNDGDASGMILRQGLVYHSVFSASFNGLQGRPVYLASANSVGSITASQTTNIQVLGYVVNDDTGIWRFNGLGNWDILGT